MVLRGDADPCLKQGTRLPKCMKKYKNDESYCFDAIETMRRCCGSWKSNSEVCVDFLKEWDKKDAGPYKGADDTFSVGRGSKTNKGRFWIPPHIHVP
ncbi:uncharacterized protein LOC141855562 [Brevipalpus obovatus]|uniref:uncharacterized protein LOC141855562 n=1 Tax=Brevipalpus obovatus TaxID=246614 RepID=UPI003D9F189B